MPKYNNPRRTWKYSNDFKVNAVQLSFVVGVTIKSVAEKLDIHPFMLSRWRNEENFKILCFCIEISTDSKKCSDRKSNSHYTHFSPIKY